MTPEQQKKLEEEKNSLDLGSILKNIGSDVLTGIGKLLPKTDDRPVFNVVPVKEKMDTINQYNTLEQELKATQEKYKDFDPIEQDFETFQKTFYPKKEEDLTANIADTLTELQTPVVTKTTAEVKSPFKAPTVATKDTTKQTLPPIQEKNQKEPEYYDLQASPTEPNLAYQQALEKTEKGALLSGLLQASSKIGRAVAGEGRLPESTDTFEEVARVYGADKRILDEMAKRVEVDERLEQSNPKSNLSKIAQEEFKQLLKLEGKEIKDLTALSNLSAKDLAPQINLAKQRQQIMADKAKAEQDKLTRAEELKYRYAALEAQERNTIRQEKASREAAELAKEQRKEDKEQQTLLQQENKTKDWLSTKINKVSDLKKQVFETKQNASRLRALLNNPVNSVEQINQIYGFIKNLDNTAVREGEVRLFREGENIFDELEIWKSKLTKNPQIISNNQFRRLVNIVLDQADKVDGYYDKVMKDTSKEFEVRADRLLKKDPEYYGEWVKAIDPDYFNSTVRVKSKDGKEAFEIPVSDLKEAEKAGYVRID